MMNTTLSKKLKDRRPILVGLALSVALNILTVSILASFLLNARLPLFLAMHDHVHVILSELSSANRDAIYDTLRHKLMPELRTSMVEHARLRTALADSIAAPDATREELTQKFDAIREYTTQSQKMFQNDFVDIIMSLPPDERIKLSHGVRKAISSAFTPPEASADEAEHPARTP